MFAARTVIASSIKQRVRWCCRNFPLPTDADPLHEFSTCLDPEQPKSDVMIQNGDHQTDALPLHLTQPASRTSCTLPGTSPVNVANTSINVTPLVVQEARQPATKQVEPSVVPKQPAASVASVISQHPTIPIDPQRSVQSSLHRFFYRSQPSPEATQRSAAKKVKGTLYDFFKPAQKQKSTAVSSSRHLEDVAGRLGQGSDSSQPTVGATHCGDTGHHLIASKAPLATGADNVAKHLQVDQVRCSASQEVNPPVFTTRQQVQQDQPQPRQAPRPAWRIHLANIFDELATVRHRETGPVMQVEVWYVHHLSHPECVAPRTVELDNIQELWYADLCNAWFDHIHRLEPMKVVNVLPTPPRQTRVGPVAHVILEQGFSPELVALHFTAVFLGGTRVGLFQRAESAPVRICTRDMIIRHGFQLQCEVRPCNMHSGLLRFHMDDPEEVFSGISAVLTVAPPPEEPLGLHALAPAMRTAPNADDVEDDDASMMQLHATAPQSAVAPHMTAPNQDVVSSHWTPFDHRMPPAAITEFRETVLWQSGHHGPTCTEAPRDHMQIRTWYLNSDSCTRTEVPRTILLRPQPHTWHQDIIEAWRDRLDPVYPVHLHVVTPNPPGTSLALELNVIVLQRPNPLWRSALLTVTQPRANPWQLQFICAMLDAETSLEQLGFISGVTHPANPNAHLMHVEAQQGQAHLRNDCSFPVRHGYWFDIQAYSINDHGDDEVAAIQLHFHMIKQVIGGLHKRIYNAPWSHMLPDQEAEEEPPTLALTAAVRPNDPGVFVNPQEALPFITALQAHWQPLAMLQPSDLPALVPIVTWYIDHIRFPQCFQPRIVLLNDNPEDWIQRIRSVWIDLIMPQHIMHVHIVQPPPPEMPTHIAAHLLVVQQPIEQFRSVLISSYDSALPTEPPVQHASITPSTLAYSTLVALAYRDAVCNHPQVDCAAWVGDVELLPNEEREVINGNSLVLAVHRHLVPIQQDETDWDRLAQHSQWRPPYKERPHPPDDDPAQDTPATPAAVRVTIYLDAVVPTDQKPAQLDDACPQLLWFTDEAWLYRLARAPPCTLHALPDGLKIPDVCYWPLVEPTEPGDPTHHVTLYLDGAANGTHAAWSVVATINLPVGEVFVGCLYGCVHIAPQHPAWIGASEMDNIAAELSALAIAQTVALRWPYEDHRICIRPDLSLSRTVANALTTCKSNTRLAQVCRIQGLWLASKVSLWEIRGHQGFAWNELADAVAKWVLVNGSNAATPQLDELHEFASNEHDVAWAWMQTTHPAMSACFPPSSTSRSCNFKLLTSRCRLPQRNTPSTPTPNRLVFNGPCRSYRPMSLQLRSGPSKAKDPGAQASAP